jgi:hypothetical protein
VWAPEPILLTAYGVTRAAPAAVATPELFLLRWRFGTRPNPTMEDLAQRARPTELVIGRDKMEYSIGQWRLITANMQRMTCTS